MDEMDIVDANSAKEPLGLDQSPLENQDFEYDAEDMHDQVLNQDVPEEEISEETPEEQPKGSRFQKRINNLVTQRNEAQADADHYKQIVSAQMALIEELKAGRMQQQEMLNRSLASEEAERVRAEPQRRHELMRSVGLEPTDKVHNFAFDQFHELQRANQRLQELEARFDQVLTEGHNDKYNRTLESEVSRQTKTFNVDENFRHVIQESAYEAALVRGLAPQEAVAETIKRFRSFLKPKTTQNIDPGKRRAAEVVAQTGKTGGRTQKTASSFEANLKELFNI